VAAKIAEIFADVLFDSKVMNRITEPEAFT
jgi:hypothetical protein